MNVLFVNRGKEKIGVGRFIPNQINSLKFLSINVLQFIIKGKGKFAYFKNIMRFKKFMKYTQIDIIHAHYSFLGFFATLFSKKPVIVSLLGSDVKSNSFHRTLIKIFARYFWKETIVKSKEMFQLINNDRINIIPNGVDIEMFKFISQEEALHFTKLDPKKKNVILFSNPPNRPVKNIPLAKNAMKYLDSKIEISIFSDILNSEVPMYMNASDVLLLTSFSEGSPNVIKEAMACGCPIVATDVGDIRWIFGNTKGCFIGAFEPKNIANKIMQAIDFREKKHKTKGRERIIELGIDSESIAKRIIKIYKKIQNEEN